MLEFEDTFDGEALDEARWLPWYLAHWSSRERAAARYSVGDGVLRLRIDEDQEPWCPELDGELRVSSLQTGATVGQHKFTADAVVRERYDPVRLYTPQYGRFELRARVSDDPHVMGALWMIGLEDAPERSAEICVCEVFGRDAGGDTARVGVGVHPFGDPAIVDDHSLAEVPVDVGEFHVYAAEWTRDAVTFFVDDREVKRVPQSPGYPMQLMLSLYEFPNDRTGPYPKELVVDRVRGYRLR